MLPQGSTKCLPYNILKDIHFTCTLLELDQILKMVFYDTWALRGQK